MKRILTLIIGLLLSFNVSSQFIGDHYTDVMRKCQYLKPEIVEDRLLIYEDTVSGWEYGFGFNKEHICLVTCYNVPDSDFKELFHTADSIFTFSRHDGQGYYDTSGPYVVELVKIKEGFTGMNFVDYGLYQYLHKPKKPKDKS